MPGFTTKYKPVLPEGVPAENPAPGIWVWHNRNNRITAVLWHYSANPKHNEEWAWRKRTGMSPDEWEREFEINFEVQGSLKAIFGRYFNPKEHIKDVVADPAYPVIRGIDFGRVTPACVFLQIVNGQVRILYEIQEHDILLRDFCVNKILPITKRLFPHIKTFETVCDIAGKQRSDKSNYSSIDVLTELGFEPRFKFFFIREGIDIIEFKLTQRLANGEPGLVIHPSCKILIAGFEGGYRWSEDGRRPLENEFCHLMDALRYCVNYYIPNYHDALKSAADKKAQLPTLTPDQRVFAEHFLGYEEAKQPKKRRETIYG